MELSETIRQMIINEPGSSGKTLGLAFGLSEYRLKRIFRHIERSLEGQILINDEENGVWIVDADPDLCPGMNWTTTPRGCYVQCQQAPEFADGRCYYHSNCENPEMTAFERRLRYLVGPSEPTAYGIGQLPMRLVKELSESLTTITPLTLKDACCKERFGEMLRAAAAFLRWKESVRPLPQDQWIPPEFAARHQASSRTPYQFTLKKHFAVLEVAVDATREEVLKAWRRLSRQYHPDTPHGNEERMKEINAAKERIFSARAWD